MAAYYWGSSGSTVARIQQRLKDLGYYSDNVDGIFGENTYYELFTDNYRAVLPLQSGGQHS